MIHTHCTGVLPTLFTPLLGSPRTFSWSSCLLLLFNSFFSEQLRFEHQLRSQLLWFKMVSRSIKRQRIENNELQASSNQDQPINHASTKQAKQQGFKVPQTAGLQRAALGPALRLCFCHHWDPETSQGFKWSPDRSSKRRFLKTKTCHIPRAKSFTQHQTASEKETSQPLLDTIPGLLFDFHSTSQTSKPFLFTSTATNRLDIRCHTVQSSQQSKEARTPASYKPFSTVGHDPLMQMPMTSLIFTVLNP